MCQNRTITGVQFNTNELQFDQLATDSKLDCHTHSILAANHGRMQLILCNEITHSLDHVVVYFSSFVKRM